jgi:hypothetical protein
MTAGTRNIRLSGGIQSTPVAAPSAPARERERERRVAVAAPPPVPPPPPPPPMKYTVEVIRGAKRTEEIVK